jgi:hypothetical protein
MAAALALLISIRPDRSGFASERSKGGFALGFYIKHGTHVRRGNSGEVVSPQDQLRFTYSSEAPFYFALLGRDARFANVYFPASNTAAPLRAASNGALDFSLLLDAEPGDEHFYAVACPSAFALEPLRRALLDTRELVAAPGCHVHRILLHKEELER